MTDAIGQPWYDEASDEQKSRMWRQRGSNGLGTGAPPPSRYVEETDVILPESELGAGATVTMQRHVHEWSVPEVMVSILPTTTTTTVGFNVLDYGAVGDGLTDDTDAIEAVIAAAVTAGGGTVYFPPGVFVLSATQAATGHVKIVGAGAGNNFSFDDAPATSIVWDGGAAAMFSSLHNTASWSFDNLLLDGGGTATYCVDARNMQDKIWGVLAAKGATVAQVFLHGHDVSCMCNVFQMLKLEAQGTANMLRLDGNATGNVCHCRFGSINGAKHGTGTGVYFGCSDNNVVVQTFIFQSDTGATTGWEFGPSSLGGPFPASGNYVWHMQSGNLIARTGSENAIGFWDRGNGQGEPTIEGTAILRYENYSYGMHLQAMLSIKNWTGDYTEFNTTGVGDNDIRGNATTIHHNLGVDGDILSTGDITSDNLRAGEALSFDGTTGPKIIFYDVEANGYFIRLEGGELRFSSGADLTIYGGGTENIRFTSAGAMQIKDGITAPATRASYASIYVDTADGDLKVKFGDGTVKTIVVDT